MAEVITKEKLIKLGLSDVVVSSAGVDQTQLTGMVFETEQALVRMGYYPGSHTPMAIPKNSQEAAEFLKPYDIILCMKNAQVKEVVRRVPSIESKVSTLHQFAGLSSEDVEDPNDILRATRAYPLLMCSPYAARKLALHVFGYADRRDTRIALDVHERVAKKIENLADYIINALIEKGIATLLTPA